MATTIRSRRPHTLAPQRRDAKPASFYKLADDAVDGIAPQPGLMQPISKDLGAANKDAFNPELFPAQTHQPSRGYSGSYDSYVPSTGAQTANVPPSIDPAYITAGVAAAGIGAAAAANTKTGRSIGSEVVGAMDSAVGAVGQVAGMVGMVGLLPLVIPLAAGAVGLLNKKAGAAVKAPLDYLHNKTFSNVGSHLSPTVTKTASTTAQHLTGLAAKPFEALGKVTGLKSVSNFGTALRNSHHEMGKASLIQGSMNTAFLTMSTVSMYGVVRSWQGQYAALEELHHDLTGTKSVSTQTLLFGKVPKAVETARNKLMSVSGIHMAAETAGLAVNVEQALFNRMSGIVGILAFSLPDQVRTLAEGFIGDSILSVYSGIRKAHASGQAVPAQAYEELLKLADEKLAKRPQQFIKTLAKEYETEKLAPAAVLEELASGKSTARLDRIIADYEKNKPIEPPKLSFVDKLQNKNKALAQPVLGAYTQKLTETSPVQNNLAI